MRALRLIALGYLMYSRDIYKYTRLLFILFSNGDCMAKYFYNSALNPVKVGGSDVQSEDTCDLFGSCCDMLRHLQQANAAVLTLPMFSTQESERHIKNGNESTSRV
jgi:hypothetical protein